MYLVSRTIGLSDYRTLGLLDRRTIRVSDYRSDPHLVYGSFVNSVFKPSVTSTDFLLHFNQKAGDMKHLLYLPQRSCRGVITGFTMSVCRQIICRTVT
jgi:hypothetical protein